MQVDTQIGRIADPVERLCTFIREREALRNRKERGMVLDTQDGVPRWSHDPILTEYRFCNVRREDDRVTRWIGDNWRGPNQSNPDLWFAMLVARFINWPDTLAELGYPVPWDPKKFLYVMADRKARKLKQFGGAYVIRADSGTPGRSTAEYQVAKMFDPYWARRADLRPRAGETLNSYHMLLGQLFGLGSFMAAQVVADLKYVEPLKSAADWWMFAASGPGSRRGLNRVLGRPVNSPWTEEDWRSWLGRLKAEVDNKLNWLYPLHAQDFQNCLCEHDKYERARLGEGRPRARYVSHGTP